MLQYSAFLVFLHSLLDILRGNRTSPSFRIYHCFFCLIVRDEKVSVLIVTVGHLVGDLDDIEWVGGLVEDFIHLEHELAILCGKLR